MRTAGSNRLRGELAGNELRTRKEYVSDRDARFKQPLERCKLLTRWAFEYFDQTAIALFMSMSAFRFAAYGLDKSPVIGMSTKSGSPPMPRRSAPASLVASIKT